MVRTRAGKRGADTGETAQNSAVPEVFREMLADAVSSSPTRLGEEGQSLKRRRVGGRVVTPNPGTASANVQDQPLTNTSRVDDLNYEPKMQSQTVYDDSEYSAESDMDWEEVDLVQNSGDNTPDKDDKVVDVGLNLVLGEEHTRSRVPIRPKRKPGTAAEKKLRLGIHKLHIMCLLAHVHLRNHWCNDADVHKVLRKLLTKRTVSYLNPDETQSQFQKSRSFTDGLGQAMDAFSQKFNITARGMSRSYWLENSGNVANISLPDDLDLPMLKSDFRSTANKLGASRDLGAQFFCAMLRSVGVDARLVCSLQPLPLTPVTKGAAPPYSKPALPTSDVDSRTTTDADDSGLDARSITSAISHSATRSSTVVKSSLIKRPGQEQQASMNGLSVAASLPAKKPKRKRIIESPYPIYWVEAFNDAVQKWIPVDPLVTRSVAKVSKFEPPASDQENNMIYVLAFEDDGSARDVTRRYAKAYNAKTRRVRVESTPGGERWLKQVMKLYRSSHESDRNQVEDAEFAAKEAAEPMPKNVQDFKDHPYYALERHLKRNELIHPKREMGKVTAGKSGGTQHLEPIYRRKDVLVVKSADKWYRLGRVVKSGEQPMKYVQTRRRRDASMGDEDDQASGDEAKAGTALYAFHQTTTYEAPPVVYGRVPRNAYGNLDIYTQSMVPRGGTYITHPDAGRAARALGIDYADAVTGFEFKGRHGMAIIRGAVVAIEYREAMRETLKALEDERIEAEESRRSAEVLRMWKRFLIGLRIRERIEGYEISGTIDGDDNDQIEEEEDQALETDGGGFLPNHAGDHTVNSTSGRIIGYRSTDYQHNRGGFQEYNNDVEDEYLDENDGGGFLPDPVADSTESRVGRTEWLRQSEDDIEGGGFVVLDKEHEKNPRNIDTADTSMEDIDNNDVVNTPCEDIANDDDEETLRLMENTSPRSHTLGNHILSQPTSVWSSNEVEKRARKDEDIGIRKEHAISSSPPTERPEETETDLHLEPEELAEARMLQQIYEEHNTLKDAALHDLSLIQDQGSTNRHMLRPAIPGNEATSTITVREAGDPEILVQWEASDAVSPTLHGNPDDDLGAGRLTREDTDRGSLLSHDPSDDDADPDWLS